MAVLTVAQRIEKVIFEEKGAEFELKPHLTLDDLAEDSVEVMEFILSLEDEFGIEIADEEIENLNDFADIVLMIENKVK